MSFAHAPQLHSVAKGDISVAMITAKLLRLGVVVLRPITELSRYDIVIDRGQGFERIQCKTGRLREGAVRFNTASNMSHHGSGKGRVPYTGQIEAFGVYCPDNDEVYLVPIDLVGTAEGRLRIDAPRNNQATGIRLAADFRVA